MKHALSQVQLAKEVAEGITLAEMLKSGEGLSHKSVENAPMQIAFALGDWQHAESLWFTMTMQTARDAKQQIARQLGIIEATNRQIIEWLVQDESIAWVANHRMIYLVKV